MTFTHEVAVHFPTTDKPGLLSGGAHLLIIEVINEMAAQGLTQDSTMTNRTFDGSGGAIFRRPFASESAAQDFVSNVDRVYTTLVHSCTISTI